MPLIKTKSRIFATHGNETLLEALERNGQAAEYQCRQGYCGHCRLRMTKGEVHYPRAPLAYVQQGEVLACCAYAVSDVELPNVDEKINTDEEDAPQALVASI